MEILSGGKLNEFSGQSEKLKEINFGCESSSSINMILVSNRGNDSLSYLTIEEAIAMKRQLQNAIEEFIRK